MRYIDSALKTIKKIHYKYWLGMFFILGFILLFYILYPTVVTVKIDGVVLPKAKNLLVNNTTNSILVDKFVQNDEIVVAGQPLLSIRTFIDNKLNKNDKKILELRTKIARLNAQILNKELNFSKQLEKVAPNFIKSERKNYKNWQKELALKIKQTKDDYKKKKKRESFLNFEQQQLKDSIVMLENELKNMYNLEQKKDVSGKVEHLEKTISNYNIQSKANENALLELSKELSKVENIEKYIIEKDTDESKKYLIKANSELNELLNEENKKHKIIINAAVKGRVANLNIKQKGNILEIGEKLLNITPMDNNYIVEFEVEDDYIEFFNKKKQFNLNFKAYNNKRVSSINAKVASISSSPMINEKDDIVYTVRFKLSKDYILSNQDKLPIQDGMQVYISFAAKQSLLSKLFN